MLAERVLTYDYRAAYCQIFDSIYLDVPMSRVKFNVNTEYAYLQNFKILQSAYGTFVLLQDGPVLTETT